MSYQTYKITSIIIFITLFIGVFLYAIRMDPNVTGAVVAESGFAIKTIPNYIWIILGSFLVLDVTVGFFVKKNDKDVWKGYENSYEKETKDNDFDFGI